MVDRYQNLSGYEGGLGELAYQDTKNFFSFLNLFRDLQILSSLSSQTFMATKDAVRTPYLKELTFLF